MKTLSVIPLAALALLPVVLAAQNPVIHTMFTPDPAPYVHGDTVYLFTDHDEDDAQYFKMHHRYGQLDISRSACFNRHVQVGQAGRQRMGIAGH